MSDMRTYQELSKDRAVLQIAVDFDQGPGKKFAMKYMQLLRCFMTATCTLDEIADKANLSKKELVKLYKPYFADFAGYSTARHWNTGVLRKRKRTATSTADASSATIAA